MFPHDFLTLQATWRLGGRQMRSERRRSSRRRRSRGPESTRSSSKHVRKKGLSKGWSNDLPHATWHPERRSIVIKSKALIWSDGLPDRHRTVPVIRIGRQRSVVEELHDRGPIEPRSRRDRAAIGEFKGCNRLQAIGERSTTYQDFDRGPIVARSWVFLRRKSRPYWSEIEAKLWLIPSQSGSYVFRSWNRRHDAWIPPHDRINCPRLSGQFLL